MSNRLLLHSLLRELRKCSTTRQRFNQSPLYKYAISQFRHYVLTTEQQCAPKHEGIQIAETYLTLLKSMARHRELVAVYRCREKTTSDAAKLVGLALPKVVPKEK